MQKKLTFRLPWQLIKFSSLDLIHMVVSSVVPTVASYRKLVAVAENRRQSIEIFHYRLLEGSFRRRNASQRINLGDPISDENTACFLHIGYRFPR